MSIQPDPDDWVSLDRWWGTYAATRLLPSRSTAERVLDPEMSGSLWGDLDSWWDTFSETGHETAVELRAVLNASNDEWRQSESPFDTDPLSADLTLERVQRGPLQPTNEVSWSRWLARVLTPCSALVRQLVDVDVDEPAEQVIREDQLSKEDGTSRRPDILVLYPDRGVSIEVKLDDTNYRKTRETAALIERNYPNREWTHTLLLPQSNIGRLRSTVDAPISSSPDGRLRIDWNNPGPVGVLYWRDVTAAIRALLRRGDDVDDHWAANAYLFCAVAEQQLLGFQPQPVVEQFAEPTSVLETIQPIRLADRLEEQLTYVSERSSL